MSKKYIGIDKPVIKRIKEQSLSAPEWELLESDADYLPMDMESLD